VVSNQVCPKLNVIEDFKIFKNDIFTFTQNPNERTVLIVKSVSERG